MLIHKPLVKISLCLLLIVAACSILKKEEPDQDIVAFMTNFQNSLSQSDEAILGYFDARQSKESILSAIRILQNKEHEFIACTADFTAATISKEETGIRLSVPVHLVSQNIEGDYKKEATLTFWLKPRKKTFVISKLDGEEFYTAFSEIKSVLQWSVERIQEIKKREPIYARAKALQQQFDSVVWYANYDGRNYFYVVKGKWNRDLSDRVASKGSGEYTMGLTNEQGAIVIPVEYDLIGTIGFAVPGLVEIKKEGKVGYFNLETNQLIVEPAYSMIIPYPADNAFALVKKDSIYGWVDRQYQYHEGFPSASAEQWVAKYQFLPNHLVMKNDTHTFCEIPNEASAGYGIIIPPSYLVATGVFDEILTGISTTAVPINGWTEYIETKNTLLQSITDQIHAVITTINERYIEGREEFYTYDRLTLVNNRQDTLAVSNIYTNGKINFRRLNDALLELQYEQNDMEGSDFVEYNMPVYAYFRLGSGVTATPYTSHRSFPQTQFVKLDSTYLSGNFKRYTEQGEEDASFLSLATITYMRNEILADYGYRFADTETADRFKYYSWYKPQYDKEEDLQDMLTMEDRHNLEFLARMIARLQGKAV